MPFSLSTKKASTLASKPEAMSSEVTLVDSSHTRSDKQATAGVGSAGTKKTKMTWKEAREHCKKQESWETRVSE